MTTTANFERFKDFHCETNFLENENLYQKLEYRFLLESTKIEMQYFYTKLPFQKPMLRQIEWEVQNGTITKNGVLQVTSLFF